jgi:hypothetical protein
MGFDDFIQEKICPLVGDVVYENFGLDFAKLRELSKEIDIIINGAATTNFFERFDIFPCSILLRRCTVKKIKVTQINLENGILIL